MMRNNSAFRVGASFFLGMAVLTGLGATAVQLAPRPVFPVASTSSFDSAVLSYLRDGDQVRTAGYTTPGLGGADYIYHTSGRPTEEGVLYFDGPRSDDYFELSTKDAIRCSQAGVTAAGARLSNAITAAAGKRLVVDLDLTLAANATIASGSTLSFEPGSVITLGAYDLTVTGAIDAPRNQIFACNSTGRVTGRAQIDGIYPEWFGAVGDASTDDASAMQRAIDFAYKEGAFGVPVKLAAKPYKIGTSLDCTYTGVAAGDTSGYYGVTIEGVDARRSVLIGACADRPMLDLTGARSCVIRNLSLKVNADDANAPACAIFAARNTNNGVAGGHLFENLFVGFYFTAGGIIGCSSESNHFDRVEVANYKTDTFGVSLSEQNDRGVDTDYIDLSSHTFAGGNTRNRFDGCDIGHYGSATTASSGGAVILEGTDSTSFFAGYTKATDGSAIILDGSNSNVVIAEMRDESTGDNFIHLPSGAAATGLKVIGGRASREIHGEDTSSLDSSDIGIGTLNTGGSYAIDLYDCTNTVVRECGVQVRIRNDASNSTVNAEGLTAAGVDLIGGANSPAAFTEANRDELKGLDITYGLSNSGRDYVLKRHDAGYTSHDFFKRIQTKGLVLAETAGAASGSTSIDLHAGTTHVFTLSGSLTITGTTGTIGSTLHEGVGQLLTLVFHQPASPQTISFPTSFKRKGWRPDRNGDTTSVGVFQQVTIDGSPEWHLVAASPMGGREFYTSLTINDGANTTGTDVINQNYHYKRLTLQAGGGSYDAVRTLSSSGAAVGDWIEYEIVKAASTNAAITIDNHDGTDLLTVNSGHGDATAKVIEARFYYNGTNWILGSAYESASAF